MSTSPEVLGAGGEGNRVHFLFELHASCDFFGGGVEFGFSSSSSGIHHTIFGAGGEFGFSSSWRSVRVRVGYI